MSATAFQFHSIDQLIHLFIILLIDLFILFIYLFILDHRIRLKSSIHSIDPLHPSIHPSIHLSILFDRSIIDIDSFIHLSFIHSSIYLIYLSIYLSYLIYLIYRSIDLSLSFIQFIHSFID